MTDDTLRTFVRSRLENDHGTVVKACAAAGLSYERVRKALQRDSIKKEDLEKFIAVSESLAGLDVLDIDRMYPGAISDIRRDKRDTTSYGEADKFHAALSDMYKFYPRLRSLAESTLYDQVNTLYDNWVDRMVMVLFCHESDAVPLEFDGANRQARSHLFEAMRSGGSVLYVFESDGQRDDRIDRGFKNLCAYLARETVETSSKSKSDGVVGLLRVPSCPFSIPYIKPALFVAPEEAAKPGSSDIARRAILTLNIPTTIDGADKAGTLFVPQSEGLAAEMQSYVSDQLQSLMAAEVEGHNLRWSSYPEPSSQFDPVAILERRLL